MHSVSFLDSVGISVLIADFAEAESGGRIFSVAGARGQVRPTLELVRLPDVLPCFPTTAKALDSGPRV